MDDYKREDNRPILVQFENGVLTKAAEKTTKFKYLRSVVKKSSKRLLVADTGSLVYTGNVLQKQQSPVTYYLGVIDKKTNRIERVERCQMCTLKPKLKEQEDNNNESKIDSEKSYREKSDNLVEAFGSSKQKRQLSSRKKNEDVQATIADKVASVTKNISTPDVKKEIKGSTPLDSINIIPPKNIEAKTKQEIYHIDDIISFQEYQFLLGYSQKLISCNNEVLVEWKKDKTYPEYILHHLSMMPLSSAERKERACYISYLHFMIELYKLGYKDIRKRDPCPDIPEPIRSNLLKEFTYSDNGKNRCCPKKYKDKQLCYILVLSLIIEEYEMNCNLLMKDLKLTVPRLSQFLRAIGCTVKTSNIKQKKPSDPDDITGLSGGPSIVATLNLPRSDDKPPTPSKKVKNEANGATPAKKVKKDAEGGPTPAKKAKIEKKNGDQSPVKKKNDVLIKREPEE